VTDAVQIALIVSAGSAIPAVAAVVLGFVNRSKIGTVETKVDGHLTAMTAELEKNAALVLELTQVKGKFQGTQEERGKTPTP
jgi:hypothetical protein